MDAVLVFVGALFALWPLQYRWSMRRVRASIRARGGDVDRFNARMDRLWIRAMLKAAPFAGLALILIGALGPR